MPDVDDWKPTAAEGISKHCYPVWSVGVYAISASFDTMVHFHLHVDDDQSLQREAPSYFAADLGHVDKVAFQII